MATKMLLGIADYHAPVEKRRARGISSPWITRELKKLKCPKETNLTK